MGAISQMTGASSSLRFGLTSEESAQSGRPQASMVHVMSAKQRREVKMFYNFMP